MSRPIGPGMPVKGDATCDHCHRVLFTGSEMYRVKNKNFKKRFGTFICASCADMLLKRFESDRRFPE